LWLREGDFFRIGAITQGAPAAYADFLRREGPFRAVRRVGLGLLLETKQTYQVPDITVEPAYNDHLRLATIELARARSLFGVPLLKENEVIGCIVIYRQEVRPFTDKQIALVTSFAAAPIALQRITDAAGVSLILILSDINMPGMSGLELLPKVKAVRPDVPVIMITAYGDAETKRKALENGAEALLTKPIDFAELRDEIDMRVERAA
jgi:CheY-like chemotaxis protein